MENGPSQLSIYFRLSINSWDMIHYPRQTSLTRSATTSTSGTNERQAFTCKITCAQCSLAKNIEIDFRFAIRKRGNAFRSLFEMSGVVGGLYFGAQWLVECSGRVDISNFSPLLIRMFMLKNIRTNSMLKVVLKHFFQIHTVNALQ